MREGKRGMPKYLQRPRYYVSSRRGGKEAGWSICSSSADRVMLSVGCMSRKSQCGGSCTWRAQVPGCCRKRRAQGEDEAAREEEEEEEKEKEAEAEAGRRGREYGVVAASEVQGRRGR